jgi:hypothetical protein
LGAQLLSVSPTAAMLAAAGVALAAGLSALTLERQLPAAIRLTPRPAAPRAPAPQVPEPMTELAMDSSAGKSPLDA